MEAGINIVGAHAESPRLDLKPNPLYQEGNLAYLKNSLLWWNKKISMDSNSTCNTWSYY